MPLYRNSRMYTAYGPAYDEGRPCDVRIGDGSIVVSYPDEEGPAGFVVYEGNEVASGHYALMAQAVNGTATLHKIPNEDILEGSWVQGGDEGRWRIDLEE
jgi:hypothetical protein